MTYDQTFVGTLAILISLGALAVAAGPWTEPYQLRTYRSDRRTLRQTSRKKRLAGHFSRRLRIRFGNLVRHPSRLRG